MGNFVQVDGTRLIRNGREVKLTGIGLGSWLNLEHYMVDLPGTDSQIHETICDRLGDADAERFQDDFVHSFIGEEDFRFLKSLGINLVRVPLNYRLFVDESGLALRTKGFQYFDELMVLAEKYEIYVLPEFHTAPGGQNPDWHSDNETGYTLFWAYPALRREFAALWGVFAKRYADREWILGYDLLNEPFVVPDLLNDVRNDAADMATGVRSAGAGKLLSDLYSACTREIRAVDKNHVIFLEGDHFASDFAAFSNPLPDAQTALTFHFYPTVWYPDLYSDRYTDAERAAVFEKVLDRLLAGMAPFSRPVLCGEAGYEIRTQGLPRVLPMIRDTLALFREKDIPLVLWSYKDTGFMGMVHIRADSPWARMSREIGKRWDHHTETRTAERLVDLLCDENFPDADRAERYVLTFRARALLYPLEAKHILKAILDGMTREEILALPASLRFTNCAVHAKFARLYTDLLSDHSMQG